MTTREKIIVAITTTALIFGLYTIFGAPNKQTAVTPLDKKSADAITAAREVLSKDAAESAAATRILANTQHAWQNNAFLAAGLDPERSESIEEMKDTLARVKSIVYSGYLEMNGEQIAILNTSECRVGDQIEDFTVKKITPLYIRLSRYEKDFEIAFREIK